MNKELYKGLVVSDTKGNKYGITKVLNKNTFFAIWIGNKDFEDKTTYKGYVMNGDFVCDNILFKKTKNGIKRVHAIGGVIGLMRYSQSRTLYDLLTK